MKLTRATPILVCADEQTSALTPLVLQGGWQVCRADGLTREEWVNVALVEVGRQEDVAELRRKFPFALVVENRRVSESTQDNDESEDKDSNIDADFVIGAEHASILEQVVTHATNYWRKNLKVAQLMTDVGRRRQRMHQLNEISLALTAQMDESELLRTILSEARRIVGCEGGSLFLVRPDQLLGNSLVFKLAQNDAVEFPFVETRLPMSSDSIAGYVAVTGNELNIKDVYHLNDAVPYKFNRSFDDKMQYRTQSMAALPMRDHRNQVVGVLQFINCKNRSSGKVQRFDEETIEVLRAIASQAAVSLQKNALLQDINQLFEGFVQASVKAIEQRDPSTSGHSFRVAETTVALLKALPNSGITRFKHMEFNEENIREVRYAALLHDFGKIGVPEAILVKANKLSADRLEVIRYRLELAKERIRRRAIEQELELLHHAPVDIEVARRRVHRQLEKQLSILDQYYEWICRANSPNVLATGEYGHLGEIRDYAFRELDGTIGSVISDHDVLALSVRRGSLTPSERRSIQAHVVYTQRIFVRLAVAA